MLGARWPNIRWRQVRGGWWAGHDPDEGGRRLVVVRGDQYVTDVIDEAWADDGLEGEKLAWLDDRFDEIAGQDG